MTAKQVRSFVTDVRSIAVAAVALSGTLGWTFTRTADAEQDRRISTLEASDSTQNIGLDFLTCSRVAELLPALSAQTPEQCAADYIDFLRTTGRP